MDDFHRPQVYDRVMSSEEPPTAAAFQRLEQAMDTANELIGELIRRLDDGGRPRLRVMTGQREGTVTPRDGSGPRLRVLRDPAEG